MLHEQPDLDVNDAAGVWPPVGGVSSGAIRGVVTGILRVLVTGDGLIRWFDRYATADDAGAEHHGSDGPRVDTGPHRPPL